jgi:hypothetical protein
MPIDRAIEAAREGHREPLTAWEPVALSNRTIYRRRVTVCDASWFANVLRNVEAEALRFSRQAAIFLEYGDAVKGVWEGYRVDVESGLARLGLTEHFSAIRENVESDNPQKWRQAMWSCRDVLVALAAYLWRDSGKTYLGTDDGMVVDEQHYINRLTAYLHCKGVTGNTRKLIEQELERIIAVLHSLNDLDSKAHSVTLVDREDARLAVVSTYTMLSQFVRRTDLEPVIDQSICTRPAAPSASRLSCD